MLPEHPEKNNLLRYSEQADESGDDDANHKENRNGP